MTLKNRIWIEWFDLKTEIEGWGGEKYCIGIYKT